MQPQPDILYRRPAGQVPEAPSAAESQSASLPVAIATAYRPEIDGLRALAVSGVVLFHAGIPGFRGGYVGVDVFFVISGYLITRQLTGSAVNSTGAWLRTFYMRRGRRILPALLVTSAVAAVAATVLLLPWDLLEFGRLLAASSAFLGNLAAWKDGDYFNIAGYVPITHFWSLAVEEQFYLAYPLVLLLLTRQLPHHRLLGVAALAVTSFAVCVWGSYEKPTFTFFFAPTRAWEILLGAIVALGETRVTLSHLVRELLAILAGMSLVLAFWFYDSQVRYPGVATVVPCVATAALLIATDGTPITAVGRLLRQRPLVFTGLISYSLYLWHLPILILSNYYNTGDRGPARLTISIVAIYAIAVLSWRLIEKPVHEKAFLRSDRKFLLTAGTVSASLLAAGVGLWLSDGLPQRFDTADVPRGWIRTVPGCEVSFSEITSANLCSYGPQTQASPKVIVWGDSHAMSLLPAYEQLADSYSVRVYFAVRPNCRPLLAVTNETLPGHTQRACAGFNSAVVAAIQRLNPSLVILNAHWVDKDADLVPASDVAVPSGSSNFRFALGQTLQRIGAGQRSICMVLDVPSFKYDMSRALVMARVRGISTDFLRIRRAEALQQAAGPERDIRTFQEEPLVTVVDPKDVLCRSDSCAFRLNGNALYGDSDHLAVPGALAVVSAIDGCFSATFHRGFQAARRK
jgi:peptidoglycan/LPS O-acetylase OafA/YrhL